MKNLLFSLSLFFLLTSCAETNNNDPAPANGEINIRIENLTDEDFQSVRLRFIEQGPDANFLDYGSLDVGAVTIYQSFDRAGSCGIDLMTELEDGLGGPSFLSSCECICSLSPGNYTATLLFLVNNSISQLVVELNEE